MLKSIFVLILFTYLISFCDKYDPPYYFSGKIEFKRIDYPNNCILICKGKEEHEFIFTEIFPFFGEGFVLPDSDIVEFKKYGIKAIPEEYSYKILDTTVCVDTLSFEEKIKITEKNIEFQKRLYKRPYCKSISFNSYVSGMTTIKFDDDVIDYVENKRNIIPVFGERQTKFSDEDIILAAHNDYSFPQNFEYDRFKERKVVYLPARSIFSEKERKGRFYDLCTDKSGQARNWMEQANQKGSVHYLIIADTETDSHFEFTLQNPDYPYNIFNMRIYKCSYFNPTYSGKDSLNNETILGKFNVKPPTYQALKDFIETILFYHFPHKILSFFGEENSSNIYFHIYYLQNIGIDYGKMLIEVNRSDYNFEINTSLLKVSHTLVKKISGLNEAQIRHYLRKKETEIHPCTGAKY